MAHIRQSRPDYGLFFQVEVLKTCVLQKTSLYFTGARADGRVEARAGRLRSAPRPRPPGAAPFTLHHTLYTLHPTPYTLHPTHTLHPTLDTLPYTLHPTPYTLNPTPDTLLARAPVVSGVLLAPALQVLGVEG